MKININTNRLVTCRKLTIEAYNLWFYYYWSELRCWQYLNNAWYETEIPCRQSSNQLTPDVIHIELLQRWLHRRKER